MVLSPAKQYPAVWVTRSTAVVVSLLFHIALLIWLLSSIAASVDAVPPPPIIPIELVKIQPRPGGVPQPAQKEDPGPPVHEISTRDDEWVAPRVNNNKSFVIAAHRAPSGYVDKIVSFFTGTKHTPSDYVDRVKSQVVRNIDYPEDAIYDVMPGQTGPPARQECRVAYELTIDRNGKLVSYKFDPCGNTKLDDAVASGLKKSGPFAPPPDFGAETYVIYGVKIFRLK